MNKNTKIYIGGFAVIAVIVIITLYYGATQGFEFGGTDDAAGEIAPSSGWFSGIWGDYELPGETESMLFALQAAIGAVIIGYFIGRYTVKKQ